MNISPSTTACPRKAQQRLPWGELLAGLLVWAACGAHAIGNELEQPVPIRINTSEPGPTVPRSFLGFSREWRPFLSAEGQPASSVHPIYLQLIRNLCAFNETPLCFRIGGNSTELMRASPPDDRWRQLAAIYEATRTPLIVNLNLSRADIALDRAMIRDAQKHLPAGAVAVFELGNEPDGWTGKHRTGQFIFAQYLQEFNSIGRKLVPELTPGLAGPAWAHGAPPQMVGDFLASQPGLIRLLTVHSYRFDPEKTHSLDKLLHESNTAGFATNFVEGLKVAHEAGLKLRLTEVSSAWGGGIKGFSDTFAAALWTTDVLFEFADAGLDGVNFHNVGTNPYSIIQEDVEQTTRRPIITASAPYYGMLLFAEATANQARLVPVSRNADKLKLWATLDNQGVTRVVIINKDTEADHDVVLEVAGVDATLKRLTAPTLAATRGIQFAGQTFDQSTDGKPVGTLAAEVIPIANGRLQVRMDAASAALLTIPANLPRDDTATSQKPPKLASVAAPR